MTAIRLMVSEGLRAEVYSFARGVKGDIDAVLKSDARALSGMNVLMTNYNKLQLTEVS